ncbi:hypothetical protein [Rheinheimera sp. WS51]|uniref:hypothetical protein n=1 Tax=Rheinheimera sp. WS51 TaxID=3425886 RepID=UPI003D89ECA0
MMNTKLNLISGMAAVCLAVLFPIYWVYAVTGVFSEDAIGLMATDFSTLNAWDLLFVIIGLLEIVVYLGLYQLCREQLNGGAAAILILIMTTIIALFHSTVVIDVLLATGIVTTAIDSWITSGSIIGISLLVLYSLVAGVFAILLLTRFSELTTIMKAFAIGLLLMCLLQLSIIFAASNIVLFPILLLLLAIQFFRNDHSIDLV